MNSDELTGVKALAKRHYDRLVDGVLVPAEPIIDLLQLVINRLNEATDQAEFYYLAETAVFWTKYLHLTLRLDSGKIPPLKLKLPFAG